MLLVPTVLQNYLVAEVEAEEKDSSPPSWDKNALSGLFTNFVNLLDMAAISVPSAILKSPDLREEAHKPGSLCHYSNLHGTAAPQIVTGLNYFKSHSPSMRCLARLVMYAQDIRG